MMAQMLFAGEMRSDDPSKKDARIKKTEEVCEIYRNLKGTVTKESALKFKEYLSDEFAKGITATQYKNIIKMFSLDTPPIDEGSSLEEKKLVLSYYLLENTGQEVLILYGQKVPFLTATALPRPEPKLQICKMQIIFT